jgi:hypothetical protein
MNAFSRFGSLALLLLVTACGGGGGSSGTCTTGCAAPTPAPGTGTRIAADITLVASKPSVNNTGSDTAVYTVTAVDINRNTVSGIPITLSVDNDATIAVSGTQTATNGTVTGTVSIGANKFNRVVMVRATSGSLTKELPLQVVGARITSTATPPVLATGSAGSVTFRLVDSNGTPMAGTVIAVTGPGGAPISGTTGVSGEYVYQYTAPSTGTTLDILASAAGAQQTTTIALQSGASSVPAVTSLVRSASVAAAPSVISANLTNATSNRSEIRALFVGDGNAPIKNVRVRFDLAADQNNVGGTFTTGTGLLYSDASGVVTTAYQPGALASPTDGVTIRACWDYADFPATGAGSCPRFVTTTLTVKGDPLSVSIGTDDKAGDDQTGLAYTKRFLIQVNDASGLAKADVDISPILDLLRYRKGYWVRGGERWAQVLTSICDNEDLNRNGVLEAYAPLALEDANGNGQLDPRKADVVLSFIGSGRTNAAGQAIIQITYLKNTASWIDVLITVAASGVSGTEGRASIALTLPVTTDSVTSADVPAFVTSPYGIEVSPTVSLTTTAARPVTGVLCTDSR